MYNNKFTKAVEIHSRIARKYKTVNIEKQDIVEWCAACTLNEIRTASEWFLFKSVELTVNSRKALMPCNVYRLLDIMDGNGYRIGSYNNGTYIFLDDDTNYSKIYISYYGIPIDEKGVPLILKGSEKACEYYCIIQLFEEDWARGKIRDSVWNRYQQQFDQGVIDAQSTFRHMTRNDIQVILSIMGNMTQKLGFVNTYNLDD